MVSVADAVLIVDRDEMVAHASDSFCRLTGYHPADLVGQPLRILGLDRRLAGEFASGSTGGEIRTKSGQHLSVSIRSRDMRVNGAEAHVLTVVNATPLDAASGPLFYDVASGDGDRTDLGAPAVAMMSGALRHGGQVMFVKARLDRLQEVNQTVGYEVGDAILQEALERLRFLAPADGMVARLATNQFALVAPVGGKGPGIEAVTHRIHEALGTPYQIRNGSYRLSASIGVAVFPVHGADLVELVYACDLALREARQRGGDRIELFSSRFQERLSRELRLDRALSEALRRDEFEIQYQPLIDLGNGGILAAEALLRWKHEELGSVSPSEFIPRAEATGLIVPIGDWVLNRAFEEAKSWEGGKHPPRINVNLSAVQFGQHDLVEKFEDALSSSKLSPERVDVELTEHSLASDVESRNETISRLRGLGMTVAIDDFGTGYSSLSQLVDCPVDSLKIDRSFVAGLIHHPQSVTIVRTIIDMGQSLDLKLAAEGTERKDQIDLLRDAGCGYAQGHYFYKAMPGAAFKEVLATAP